MYGRLDSIFNVPTYLNAVDDSVVGGISGLGGVPGQLGMTVALTTAQALQLSNTSTGTLYGGLYQYVRFRAGSTASNARGQLVCAYGGLASDYVVTPDFAIADDGRVVGVTLNAVTKGNYGWIQVGGLASVLFRASVTAATDGVIVTQLTTTATADGIANATGSWIGGGALGLKNVIGVAAEAPANGAVKRVWLKNLLQLL